MPNLSLCSTNLRSFEHELRFVGKVSTVTGFVQRSIPTTGATINVLTGGQGPPLLLLHGYPQTHLEWRKIAPELARDFTLVMPDLRGYGDSAKPEGGDGHVNYSKRAMALDQVEVMSALGFDEFALVGHDRGARVSHRLALDHPDRVTKLALLDICPTLHMYNTANRAFATIYFHWFFLIQPEPLPEKLIGGDPEAVLKQFLGAVAGIEPEAFGEYLRCFSDPATIHATWARGAWSGTCMTCWPCGGSARGMSQGRHCRAVIGFQKKRPPRQSRSWRPFWHRPLATAGNYRTLVKR
jgi:haloacetate dehalogenase